MISFKKWLEEIQQLEQTTTASIGSGSTGSNDVATLPMRFFGRKLKTPEKDVLKTRTYPEID